MIVDLTRRLVESSHISRLSNSAFITICNRWLDHDSTRFHTFWCAHQWRRNENGCCKCCVLFLWYRGEFRPQSNVDVWPASRWVASGARGPEICSHPCSRTDIVYCARVASCPHFSHDSRKSHLGSCCICLELYVGKVLGVSMKCHAVEWNAGRVFSCFSPPTSAPSKICSCSPNHSLYQAAAIRY